MGWWEKENFQAATSGASYDHKELWKWGGPSRGTCVGTRASPLYSHLDKTVAVEANSEESLSYGGT